MDKPMVTKRRYWLQHHYVVAFISMLLTFFIQKTITNISNLSPTQANIRHQNRYNRRFERLSVGRQWTMNSSGRPKKYELGL